MLGRKRTGDESYLASLMRGLARVDGDHEYVVYVRDVDTVARSFGPPHRFRFHGIRPASLWIRYPLGLPRALRRDAVDLLHVQYFRPPRTRCPVVVTAHDISFAVHPEFFTRRDRILLGTLVPRSLRLAQRVIVDAEYTKQDLLRVYGLNPATIAVIPLAADPKYQPGDREQARRFVAQRHSLSAGFVLYVGTLQPRKNVATLVRAFARFKRRTRWPHKLLIVGKPKYLYDAVFDALRECPDPGDVVFTGFVADEDLPRYYQAAEAFVFPSLYEGFGLPVLEAMACGTPVVAARASCLPEIAGDAAMLVDPADVDGFADALAAVCGQPNLAAQMVTRGLARAARYHWDLTARQTLDVYRDVRNEWHHA